MKILFDKKNELTKNNSGLIIIVIVLKDLFTYIQSGREKRLVKLINLIVLDKETMKILIRFTLIVFFNIFISSSQALALNWHDCVSVALKKNPSLEMAREKISQKKSDTGIAAGSQLPQATASVQAGSSGTKTSNPDSILNNSTTNTDSVTYSLSASQLIFDGMKTPNNIYAAKSSFDASRYEYMVTESNIRLSLRKAYVKLLATQENLSTLENILKRRQENFDLVSIRYEAGKENKGSVLKAKANLSQAQAELEQGKREISLARIHLCSIMGINADPAVIAEGDIRDPQYPNAIPDFHAIAANAPLLQQMLEVKKAMIYSYRSDQGAFFPSIYGYFNAGGTQYNVNQDQKSWSAGLGMSYSLSDGGQRYNNARKSESMVKEAEAQIKQSHLNILYTLSDKWYALQNAMDDIEVSRQYLEAAQERSKIGEAQYSIGLILFNNWTIIEDELVSAQKNYLTARATALYAEAEWVQAQGGTFSYDNK